MKSYLMCSRIKFLLACSFALLAGCDTSSGDDAVPFVSFPEIYLNLSLPENIALKTDGGYMYNNEGGARGLIIYRKNATTYLAFERNCTYRPNEACATVNIDASALFMIDPCCNSTFSFADGYPTGGPAWRPLVTYHTTVDGNDLYITDEIVEP